MKIKELFERKYTLKYYEIKGIIIITLISTLLLVNIWPRFLSDVLEVSWYFYVILIVILLIFWKIWKRH
jgi:hypothetical protein